MLNVTINSKNVDSRLNLDFLRQLSGFVGKIKSSLGFNVEAYSDWSLNHFSQFECAKQEQVQNQFNSYAELIEIPENVKEISEQKLLESCAKKLKIVFDPNVYETITSEHIVEIYTESFYQIYRNLGFFNLCSYNLLDLLTNEYYELYERSFQVNSLLLEATQKLSNRPYSLEPTSLLHIPRHIMREKFSTEKKAFMIQFQAMYPIYKWNRDFYGFLVVQEAKEVPQSEANLHFI